MLSLATFALGFAPGPVPRLGAVSPLSIRHQEMQRSITMVDAVAVGTPLPDVDVELVPDNALERGAPTRVKIAEALGGGKTVLLGMPGAFTPTCNDRHLPGYYTKADQLKSLGVSKVAVCTMNDRFVNAKWQKDMEECTGAGEESPVMLLSDPRGDLAESLGLIAYLGREFGVRTKRFALVVEDGIIKKVAIDEGVNNLDATSVESMIDYLRSSQPMKAPEINGATVGGALVAGLALVLLFMEAMTNF